MSIVEVKPSYTISDRYSMLPLAGIQVKDCIGVISNEVKTNRLTNEKRDQMVILICFPMRMCGEPEYIYAKYA